MTVCRSASSAATSPISDALPADMVEARPEEAADRADPAVADLAGPPDTAPPQATLADTPLVAVALRAAAIAESKESEPATRGA